MLAGPTSAPTIQTLPAHAQCIRTWSLEETPAFVRFISHGPRCMHRCGSTKPTHAIAEAAL